MSDALPVPAAAPAPVAVALLPASDYLTLGQVAQRLNVSVRFVRGLRQSGALPVVRLGPRFLRVRPEDLARFIEERMARPMRRRAAR